MPLIKLHRWSPGMDSFHGSPVFVKYSRINWMWRTTQDCLRDKADYSRPLAERPREDVTWIDFGGAEDSGFQVIESPEEIRRLAGDFPGPHCPVLTFPYRNHRNEVEKRIVSAERLEFLPNPGYGYPPGWFITGRDNARDATRSFSLDRIAETAELTEPLSFSLRTYR